LAGVAALIVGATVAMPVVASSTSGPASSPPATEPEASTGEQPVETTEVAVETTQPAVETSEPAVEASDVPAHTSEPMVETSEAAVETTDEPSASTLPEDAPGGPIIALVLSGFVAVGGSLDLSTDPADVDGVDGIADLEAFICCGGDDPTALRPLNGAGWSSASETWDTASLTAAQAASYSTAAGGFIPSEFEVYYVKTGNDRFYKLRFPTGGTNDNTGISIEWDYLGAGTIPAPTASFTFTSYDVFTSFADTSTGTPSSWSWTFGDGESSTFQNPFHSYAGAGTFEACLTATNIGGSDGPVCQDVTISEEPSTTVAAGGTIDFDADGTTDLQLFTPSGCSEPNAFDVINGAQWSGFSADYRTQDLADAQAASLSSSNFCVESGTPFEGFFVVTGAGTFVKVWTPSNTASGVRFVFEVLGTTQPPPVASFTFTTYDVLVSFTDTSTGDPTNWAWTFGDGGSSTAQNPFHSYAGAGTFEACLTASNGGGSDGPVCQDVTISEEPSSTVGPDATFDFDGDGTPDLQVDPTTDCGGNPPNRFLVLNGAQWSGFSGADYRTLDLADAQGGFFGTSPFCVEAGTPFEGFFVLTGAGTYVKVWTPSNTTSGVRFIFEALSSGLAATATCAADGSATVEITSGDGPFDIDYSLDGVAQPQLSDVAAGSHTLPGDDLGPNAFTGIVVTEVGGDIEVLNLTDLECNVPLQATAECVGDDLVVTITSGDADFDVTATQPGGPFTDTLNALGATTYTGPDEWQGATVTEVGGDGESSDLGNFICGTPGSTPIAVGEHCNTAPITVPAVGTAGVAGPYPSTITVSGEEAFTGLVTVQLAGIAHTFPGDIDVLLVGPTGANVILMSDVGGGIDVSGVVVTFADSGPPLGSPLGSGTNHPTNNGGGDSWPAPAPAPSGATTLATFGNTDPNGVWSLYVLDDEADDLGSIGGGWCLTILSDVAPGEETDTVVESAPNPSLHGENVTFTATVTSAGTPVTDGTVTFSDGSTPLGDADVDGLGQAVFTTDSLAPGNHSITATFNGATGFRPSDAMLLHFVTSAVRTCTAPITVPATGTDGVAEPYPSTITVGGVGSVTTGVSVRLDGLTHTFPSDVDILLVGPTGENAILMSDVGGNTDAVGAVLTFSDLASVTMGQPVVTGTYRPTNSGGGDSWPAPAPTPSGATALATFNGTDPNGTWSLYVVDDAGGDSGSIGGWCLFVATAITPTETALTSTPNPSTFGQAVTFTATVTGDGAPVTEGTVTFTDVTTSTVLGVDVPVDAQGEAIVSTSTLGVGDHQIVASYSGTADFPASDSMLTQTVGPVADAGGPYNIAEGDDLNLDATASAAGPATTFSWDVNGDGTFGDATGASPTLTWAQLEALGITNGGGVPRPITVRLTDASTSSTADTTLTATNSAATVTFDGPSTALVGVPVTLKVGAIDPSSTDMAGTFTYTVDWGDGTPAVTLDGPADPPVTHTYTAPGVYTVTATVTDPDGATSEPFTFTITVTQQAPTTTSPAPTTTSPASTTSAATTTSTPSGALPTTGSTSDVPIIIASVLVVLGTATLLATRRFISQPSRRS
jgi:PKD repeat protein